MTDEQRAYILAHPADSPTAIARHLGIARTCIYHVLGHRRERHNFTETPEEVQRIADLYREHTAQEVADVIGWTYNRVTFIIRKHRLMKSPEGIQRNKDIRCSAAQRPEKRERARQTMNEIWQSELRRIRWGMDRRTRLRVRTEPPKVASCMRDACRRRDYFEEPMEYPFILFYDRLTRRSPTFESYAAAKYHIRFLPADEE